MPDNVSSAFKPGAPWNESTADVTPLDPGEKVTWYVLLCPAAMVNGNDNPVSENSDDVMPAE